MADKFWHKSRRADGGWGEGRMMNDEDGAVAGRCNRDATDFRVDDDG